MKDGIPYFLETQGYRGRVVCIDRLSDLGREIRDRYSRGQLNEDLYRRYLSEFDVQPPEDMPDARSLIVVAYADPPVRFSFEWRGTTAQLLVPPTYLSAEAKDAAVEAGLSTLLEPAGCRITQISAPKKLLAVRSGLARYGRNNIAYVEGLGSYHRLAVFCSDWYCEGDRWTEPRMLDRCESCRACRRGCPTGAREAERFLLRAERCLTFWNEKPSETPFPDWMEEGWHSCLVGCLECQRLCPENEALKDWYEEGAVFSEGETELLLSGVDPQELPQPLTEKLQSWDLLELDEQLPRNLSAALACLEPDS